MYKIETGEMYVYESAEGQFKKMQAAKL